MTWSDVSFDPPARTLRQFAGLWLACFLAVAAWRVSVPAAMVALAVGPIGLWRPRSIRLVYVGATLLTFPVGWTVSRLLLAAVFYGVLTPVGLAFRLAGRDVLGLRPRRSETYWAPKPGAATAQSYLHPF
jgi:hypothetical protein